MQQFSRKVITTAEGKAGEETTQLERQARYNSASKTKCKGTCKCKALTTLEGRVIKSINNGKQSCTNPAQKQLMQRLKQHEK